MQNDVVLAPGAGKLVWLYDLGVRFMVSARRRRVGSPSLSTLSGRRPSPHPSTPTPTRMRSRTSWRAW